MAQCEMCGKEVSNPKTVKVEGAEIDVCDDCADFGTEVKTDSSSSTSTKYSTSSSSQSSGSSGSSQSSGGSSGGRRRRDMFDEMEELAGDYDDRLRNAREQEGLSQEELADELNEKASVIRKLERGDSLPSDDVREKLENHLGISLTESGDADADEDWSSSGGSAGLTLGDKVRRKGDDG
ncbi:multiprotein bridging factor aMBF1 [Halobacterium jilantaiense]|uniref:Transcriptional regulator, XRE family n=1 Tax=Halobacterium jilantaiense TaxID=355548 RepID=A0A1I0MUT1_9EURY|nr:multiprotein bridging factor aMBF1 [Halobacterium jilantaiense]SEV92311.1 transcriptional regulator, XRE family [Halobacterium jilantaiense]